MCNQFTNTQINVDNKMICIRAIEECDYYYSYGYSLLFLAISDCVQNAKCLISQKYKIAHISTENINCA